MNKYALVVAYKGTHYAGWQIQKKEKSVAGTMQTAFYKTFGKVCTLIGASRTDAGVHAVGQVALCKTELSLTCERLFSAWNNALPLDISIQSLQLASPSFHPFHHVLYKTYKYTIFTKRPLPHYAPFGWFYSYLIDIELLKSSLSLFIGTHDFFNFCTYTENINTIRTIQCISMLKNKNDYTIDIIIKGHSFLQHMIRRIVGAAITVASHRNSSEKTIKECLEKKVIAYPFQTAPAHGLSLESVMYQSDLSNK